MASAQGTPRVAKGSQNPWFSSGPLQNQRSSPELLGFLGQCGNFFSKCLHRRRSQETLSFQLRSPIQPQAYLLQGRWCPALWGGSRQVKVASEPRGNTSDQCLWPLPAWQRGGTIVTICTKGPRQMAENFVVAGDAEMPVSLPPRIPRPTNTFKESPLSAQCFRQRCEQASRPTPRTTRLSRRPHPSRHA